MGGVLIRTARHDFDYAGGYNNFTSIERMGKDVRSLFEREKAVAGKRAKTEDAPEAEREER